MTVPYGEIGTVDSTIIRAEVLSAFRSVTAKIKVYHAQIRKADVNLLLAVDDKLPEGSSCFFHLNK